ncbi:MAG: AMP-binding protein, partial [Magnetospiraceae bacterium]
EGPGMIADKAEADLVPIRIDGAQYTAFSRLKGKFRLRRFPKITLTILPPRRFTIDPEIKGRQRRALAGQKLYDLMSDLIFQTCDIDRTLFDALLEAKAIHGPKKVVLEDVDRTPVTYKRLITGALVLGRRWAAKTAPGEAVGLMLPNSAGAVVAFFGLSAYGRVPAMLNFSTGSANMIAAIQAAQVTKVVTSRRFIMMARLQELVAQLAEHVSFIYLEDERYDISPFAKIYGALRYPFAERIHRGAVGAPETAARDGAVILFTSGSEGQPKGVSLSHRNLLANRYQLAARIDFNPTDTVFNALPVFHSFGLTGGTLLPVLSGIRIFMYPSPLHYRIIPALVYDTNATILFGTDTFLTGYARVAHPYDFYALRYVFAGAERVREETRRQWSDTFGVRILEGYGATETAPVLAVNTAMHFKAGTVGRFLPGIDTRMDPVPGVTDGARLSVTGPNVMRGYLKADNPGVLQPPPEGWYDTGDIVAVDDFGFVTIKGRAKRFAKIAGEMVSLTAVEALAGALWPDNAHAVVAIPDPKKGEQLVLVTDREDATREALLQAAKEKGLPELAVPKTVKPVESVPILGTGKVDYPSVTALVTE